VRMRIPPKELRAIWDRVPSIDCKGECSNSCGPIGCSSIETELIEERAGREFTSDEEGTCVMLKLGRCSVYSIRPVICRLWGVIESMPCPHGCTPERVLSDAEGFRLMGEAMDLAGDDDGEIARRLIESAPPAFWDALQRHAAGAPDLKGNAIHNREPAARRLLEEARRIR
jgi:Fe-S-cluster containining protein